MDPINEPVTVAQPLEGVITRIPGVRAARVVASADRIEEIHVIAGTDRAPKQLVRDIQSAARASFDLEIDYRTVSIVQLDDPAAVSEVPRIANRLPLLRVVGSTSGQLSSIEVVLRQGDLEVVGKARGAATQIPLLVARATLSAFEPLLAGQVAEVEGIERVSAGGVIVVVAVVRLVATDGARLVSGSAIAGADENDAIARATLAAVNRVPA